MDDEDGNKAALQRYKMVDARLRRLCERKGSGKLKVPQAIHDAWAAGGKQRDELRALLEEYDFDQDSKLICVQMLGLHDLTKIHLQLTTKSSILF